MLSNNNFLALKLKRVHSVNFTHPCLLCKPHFPVSRNWLIMVRLRMDIWAGRRWFGIFGDKIPAFSSMDGGEPSGGGFMPRNFLDLKDTRGEAFYGVWCCFIMCYAYIYILQEVDIFRYTSYSYSTSKVPWKSLLIYVFFRTMVIITMYPWTAFYGAWVSFFFMVAIKTRMFQK